MTRRGLTLVELLVALVVAATVVSLSGSLLRSVLGGLETLRAVQAQRDSRLNGRRELTSMLRSVAAGVDGATDFVGRPDQLECTVWQRTAGGWMEPRSMRLSLSHGRLEASAQDRTITVFEDVDALELNYLATFERSASWLPVWRSPVSVPAAMRIVAASARNGVADTLIVVIGPRG